MAATFGRTLGDMWARWFPAWQHEEWSLGKRIFEGESYYTHGPLVPLISLAVGAILIHKTSMPCRPSRWLGGIVIAASLLIHLLACLARVSFVSGFAMIGLLAGLVLLLWGRGALRRLWFPLVFLLFMAPLPEVTIAQLNFRLKMLAADWGVAMANLVGVVAERLGNKVFLENDKSLVIANVCSGLRTLISLLAFGALWAYVCRLRGVWRAGLFVMTVPLAIVANAIRIMTMIVVADVWTVQFATGWYHDTSGILIFVVAFLLMFGLESGVLKLRSALGRPAVVQPLLAPAFRRDDPEQWHRLGRQWGSRSAAVALVAIGLSAGATVWLSRTVPSQWSRQTAMSALPTQWTWDRQTFTSYDLMLDDVTLVILESPDYLYRRYVPQGGGSPLDLCVIFSRDNRKGIHPPDLCLEGMGQDIVAKTDVTVPLEFSTLPCRELVVQGPQDAYYFLYVYRCGDTYTRSFWRQQSFVVANGLLNRAAAGALIRVSAPVNKGNISEARTACLALLRMAAPKLDTMFGK